MATAAVGQLVYIPLPLDTDNSPSIGKVMVVATNANIVQESASAGDVQGDGSTPTVVTVTDAQLANQYFDITPSTVNPPGTVGQLDFGGVVGKADAMVLKSWILTIPEAGHNPYTGASMVGGGTIEVLYIQILKMCNGTAPALVLGGQRLTIATDPPTGAPVWAKLVVGPGVTYATIPAGG